MPNNQASNAPGLSQTVLTTLSALVKDWLQGFLDALQTYHRFVGVPPPHPSYPLPAEFPFEGLSEVFHWIQVVDDATQVNHNLPVKVSLLPGRADHWEPLLWVIHSGTTVIGSVELDRRIYADQSVVSIDPVFILESLILAVSLHRKVVVSSRIILTTPPTSPSTIWTEIFEIRQSDTNRVLRELGRRNTSSQPRFCPTCQTWLPHAGPNYCLEHLSVSYPSPVP
ncbi:hypothetical protein Moror_7938 [Moniliophthora roreri MCA 2997]|uniref:Uncharacterized protein n=1 Tax=Moniliophthora roreri (strain MCA 2997) TaxID=1381753 RepID=V2WT20_MONRO|nr:hypothetical protein Moror_7938 [Moniliophthora roreri MCA 2997]